MISTDRDATYTTQPLELLNAFGFENLKNHTALTKESEDIASPQTLDNGEVYDHQLDVNDGTPKSTSAYLNHHQELASPSNLDGYEGEGVASPSGRSQKSVDGGIPRSQTIGQRIMGNMMDNLLLRSFTSKSKGHALDASVPSSPAKVSNVTEPDAKDEEETPLLQTVRGKCITQLLLLGAIDSIQRKYWSKLKVPQKIAIMDILFSVLEFATSYNSYSNLRMRMQYIPAERPPISLLRQELAGTCIYLDILQKATGHCVKNKEHSEANGSSEADHTSFNSDEEKLVGIAEDKLVSFCEQVLKEASALQCNVVESTNMDIHRVLELRSPVIVKVLKGMSSMNTKIFRRHLREFYPLLTKLVCCDQMDVRGALGDLFKTQLMVLLPS